MIRLIVEALLIIAAYFIGRNRGKAAVMAENAKLEELQKELSAALARGGAWAQKEWDSFLAMLKSKYVK